MKNIRQLNFLKCAALVVIFGCLSAGGFGQSKKLKRSGSFQEQVSFSSEGKITNAIKLPANVLKQLAEYDEKRLAECQRDDLTRRKNLASHFAASKINFNGDQHPDLIVQARTLCFMGAHNTTFWIFTGTDQKTNTGYKLTFNIAADYLKVLKTSTKGLRNIETASHTAVELYTIKWKFDGEKYRQSECQLRDGNDKITKVECNP